MKKLEIGEVCVSKVTRLCAGFGLHCNFSSTTFVEASMHLSHIALGANQVPITDWCCHIALGDTADFGADVLRFEASSPVNPACGLEYNFDTEQTQEISSHAHEKVCETLYNVKECNHHRVTARYSCYHLQ